MSERVAGNQRIAGVARGSDGDVLLSRRLGGAGVAEFLCPINQESVEQHHSLLAILDGAVDPLLVLGTVGPEVGQSVGVPQGWR